MMHDLRWHAPAWGLAALIFTVGAAQIWKDHTLISCVHGLTRCLLLPRLIVCKSVSSIELFSVILVGTSLAMWNLHREYLSGSEDYLITWLTSYAIGIVSFSFFTWFATHAKMSGSLFAALTLWHLASISYLVLILPEPLASHSICYKYALALVCANWLMAVVNFTNMRMATLEFHDKEREQESSRDHPRHPQPRLLLKG